MDLKATKKSLKNLLAIEEQQFRIPPYQRPYSWTFDQVDDLWGDLVAAGDGGHFLGSIVLSAEDEDKPLVVDGQQRLTTLMLLLSALRSACFSRGMAKEVQRIDKRMTADDMAEGDGYFKLKSGQVNWSVLRDFVLRGPHDPERKPLSAQSELLREDRSQNRALLDNLARLQDFVEAAVRELAPEDQKTWLRSFERGLMEHTEFVVIEVTDLGDAFLLFETLNDRGLQLSAADLLKSHILGQIAKRASSEDVDGAAADWDSMLDSLGPDVDVSRFLRHYLLGTVPTVRKEEVFGHFKSLVSRRGAGWVLNDLLKASAFYGEFENPHLAADPRIRAVLEDLQILRARTCYIALLPARRYLTDVQFVDFARLAEVLTFRYSSVGGLGTNDLERRYRDAAQILIDSQGLRLAEAREILIGAMPDSQQFQAAFSRLRMGTQYLLRYTLQRIENYLAYDKETQLKASTLVHIEHIMPQKLSDPWLDDLGPAAEDHADYVNRYGNLTLLFSGLNIPASNKSFGEKKAFYAESHVALTQRLAEMPAWGPREIDLRQMWLAELADRVWPKPELYANGSGAGGS